MNSITRLAAFGLLATLIAGPAAAQMNGMAGASGAGSPEAAPTPQPRVPDIAPAGVPGAGSAPLATGPNVVKATTGDPTVALFGAVNNGDYNAAQDAISRGANVDAQNDLGETPLELAIALNRTQITFLILANRNDTGGTAVASAPPPAPARKGTQHVERVSTPPVKINVPTMSHQTGTPDPSAGFLGFGK
jgi:hypothetical protein